MIPKIVEAKHVKNFTVFLRFSDGTEGQVNLETELYGDIFAPLKDPAYFRKFIFNPELHTIVWPNGADFAPEFLYDKVKVLE